MTTAAPTLDSVRRALAEVSADATALDMFGSDAAAPGLPTASQRRRATRRGEPDPLHRASLFLNADGVLEWHLDAALDGAAARSGGRRSLFNADDFELPDGELVDVFEFETLGANSVGAFLQRVDERLNPRLTEAARLWRLLPADAGQGLMAVPLDAPPQGAKRRLLLVHGTFSKSQAFLDGIGKAPNGAQFWARVFATYDEVLAFEHPTLAVSPVMNALDLQRELIGIQGTLDIIAHSRGGLVTRWALEAFGLPAATVRAVLVGSPLGGTSLASPPRLKATLGLLSNFGSAVKAAGGLATAYLPLLVAPLAILKVATSVAGVVAKTPVLDGTIAMIPGLAAQSRISNNPELIRLHRLPAAAQVQYCAITSDFEPTEPGWRFWQWFRGKRFSNAVADKVFPGANDLVVDTESMSEGPAAIAVRHDFGRNAEVHHTNYFEQRETLNFIIRQLGL